MSKYSAYLFYSLVIKPDNVGAGKVRNSISLRELKSREGTLKNEDVYEYFRTVDPRTVPRVNYDLLNIYLAKFEQDGYSVEVVFVEVKNSILITTELMKSIDIVTFSSRHIKISNNLTNVNWFNYNLSLLEEALTSDRLYDLTPLLRLLKTKLYDYQVDNINWMRRLEEDPVTYRISNNKLIQFPDGRIYNYDLNRIINEEDIPLVKFRGGIIADEMGIGKTLQLLTHCIFDTEKRSLIVVPNHLKAHWVSEVSKHFDFEPENIRIVTFNEFNSQGSENPFDRLVVDEIQTTYTKPEYRHLFEQLVTYKSQFKWGISGTPFSGPYSLFSLIKFLSSTNFHNHQIERMAIYQPTYQALFRRNVLQNVQKFINLPSLQIENRFLDFSIFERNIYQAEVNALRSSDIELLRRCCCNVIKQFVKNQNETITEEMVYQNVLLVLKNRWEHQKRKEEELREMIAEAQNKMTDDGEIDANIRYYEGRLKEQMEVVANRKRSYLFLENQLKYDSKKCPICFDAIDKSTGYCMFPCHHYFCTGCAKTWLERHSNCPHCRQSVSRNEAYFIDETAGEKKYSTKENELINILKQQDGQFLLYTQYDFAREHLQSILVREGFSFSVFESPADIQPFRDERRKVLILSSNKNAEGLDLSFVQNVIIFEPIIGCLSFLRDVEKQIIGRLYRINQVNQVNVFRLIIRNTIEEEIYNGMI